MKNTVTPFIVITLLLFCFGITTCKKERRVINEDIQHTYELKATVTLKPTDVTAYYDLFVSNDKNTWLWIKRLKKADVKSNPLTFGFDAPVVCNVSIEKKLPVFGASRETILEDGKEKTLEMNFTSVTVK